MTLPPPLATGEEIHAHLTAQLNLALRRPGMFGGEPALRQLLDLLLFTERRAGDLARQQRDWESCGLWSAVGVTGAIRNLLGVRDGEYGMASVYAEFAQRRGWLTPDRLLTEEAYEGLSASARRWAEEDRTWPDVTAEFGDPSVLFGGSNPLYGKTLGYLSEDPARPMVSFHLWNGCESETESWPPDHEQPLLLAVRFGDGPLPCSVTFTPEGERRRASRGR
ncbi:hypothetical protein [Kitasatospora brasiliensis]|uniref:hypothetical protein n=1 Tax=Kitasatospora brasiliensis TaxID=3058040 RepID=UPI00292E5BFE|nr:hypothetical protein [Kitasatospora sp. K002]